jgi:hypothetical protein
MTRTTSVARTITESVDAADHPTAYAPGPGEVLLTGERTPIPGDDQDCAKSDSPDIAEV